MLILSLLAQTDNNQIISSAATNTINVVSNITESAQGFFAALDWSKPSWDLFIILFFLIAALLYGLSMGRDRAIVLIVSIYMALAVVDYAPLVEKYISNTALHNLFIFKITSFLVVFLVLFFLLAQSALLNTIASRSATRSWLQAIFFSFLQVGLLISIVLSFLPASASEQLSSFTKTIFVDEWARFFWIAAPIVLMAAVRRPKRKISREIDDI